MEFTLDLSKHRVKSMKVFTGRDFGKKVKEQSKLNDAFDNNDKVVFVIPSDTFSITPSFLEELFLDVVEKYGKEAFFQKLEISTTNVYDVTESLIEAVDRILQKSNGLSK